MSDANQVHLSPPSVDIERLGAVQADLAAGAPRREVLAGARISDAELAIATAYWLKAMSDEVRRGETALSQRYARAFVERHPELLRDPDDDVLDLPEPLRPEGQLAKASLTSTATASATSPPALAPEQAAPKAPLVPSYLKAQAPFAAPTPNPVRPAPAIEKKSPPEEDIDERDAAGETMGVDIRQLASALPAGVVAPTSPIQVTQASDALEKKAHLMATAVGSLPAKGPAVPFRDAQDAKAIRRSDATAPASKHEFTGTLPPSTRPQQASIPFFGSDAARRPSPPAGTPAADVKPRSSIESGTVAAVQTPAGPTTPFKKEHTVIGLSLRQYAALCVDIAAKADTEASIFEKYRLTLGQKNQLHEGWEQLMKEYPVLRSEFFEACNTYRKWRESQKG